MRRAHFAWQIAEQFAAALTNRANAAPTNDVSKYCLGMIYSKRATPLGSITALGGNALEPSILMEIRTGALNTALQTAVLQHTRSKHHHCDSDSRACGLGFPRA